MKSMPILNVFSNHKYKYTIPFNNDICFMDSISKTLVHKGKPLSIRKIDKHESYIYYNEILFNAHITVKYLFYKNKLYAVEFSANNLLNLNSDFIIKSFEKLINDDEMDISMIYKFDDKKIWQMTDGYANKTISLKRKSNDIVFKTTFYKI